MCDYYSGYYFSIQTIPAAATEIVFSVSEWTDKKEKQWSKKLLIGRRWTNIFIKI